MLVPDLSQREEQTLNEVNDFHVARAARAALDFFARR
jgi:hypothetical protein